jgi:hypothetical protein
MPAVPACVAPAWAATDVGVASRGGAGAGAGDGAGKGADEGDEAGAEAAGGAALGVADDAAGSGAAACPEWPRSKARKGSRDSHSPPQAPTPNAATAATTNHWRGGRASRATTV